MVYLNCVLSACLFWSSSLITLLHEGGGLCRSGAVLRLCTCVELCVRDFFWQEQGTKVHWETLFWKKLIQNFFFLVLNKYQSINSSPSKDSVLKTHLPGKLLQSFFVEHEPSLCITLCPRRWKELANTEETTLVCRIRSWRCAGLSVLVAASLWSCTTTSTTETCWL